MIVQKYNHRTCELLTYDKKCKHYFSTLKKLNSTLARYMFLL